LKNTTGITIKLAASECARLVGFLMLFLGLAIAPSWASQDPDESSAEVKQETAPLKEAVRPPVTGGPRAHRFFDKTNAALFFAVGAGRTLDYTSTRHFRNLGRDEILLTNAVVDNKPLFAAIEAGGAALSIGVSYLLHRAGHHKLERWVSVIHIGVSTFGAVRNYNLDPIPRPQLSP